MSRDDAPTSRPQAMTSKQAKKRYKEANKGPKLTKAEQRRIELEEQERIRKELDKQKSANKARIAREKKKAKEQAEIQARKKKGLPLVDVHPSQDTISRFIRKGVGNAAPKRDSSGNVKDKAAEPQSRTVSPEGDDSNKENIPEAGKEAVESPRKRPRLDENSPPKSQDAATIPAENSPKRIEDKIKERSTQDTPKQAPSTGQPRPINGSDMTATSQHTSPVEDMRRCDPTDQANSQLRSQKTPTVMANVEDMPRMEDRKETASQRHSQQRQSGKAGSQSSGRMRTNTTSSNDKIQTPEEFVMAPLPKPRRLHPDRHLEDMGLSRRPPDKKVTSPKEHDLPPPMPVPARKVVKPLPTGMRPRPALRETHGNQSTPPKLSNEAVPPRDCQKPELARQEKQPQMSKENSQPMSRDVLPKPPVAHAVAEASKSTLSPQPHRSPMPPPPRPSASTPQPSHTATSARSNSLVPQQPTAAPTNPPKLPSTTSNPSRFASPYKAMGPPPSVPQRPPAGPPRFKQPMVRPSNGAIQKPKFLPRNHLQAAAVTASPSKITSAPAVPSNNMPPSSTQLFVMSHLDDLLPSPSQELRELEEDVQPTPASRAPAFKPSPLTRGQVPVVAPKSPLAPGPGRFVRQTSHVQVAPPRPRIQEVKPAEDDLFPFLSTQDLVFSSQDIRELESDTPCKANNRNESLQPPPLRPSPKTTSSSPSITTNKGHDPSPTTATTPVPKSAPSLAAEKQLEKSSATSNPSPRGSVTATPRASPSLVNEQAEVPNPDLPTASAATPSAPKPASPAEPPSPQRFFGSSGVGIQILLAMAASEKTFREDEERRQEKARREKVAEEKRKRVAEQQAKRAAEMKRRKADEERAKVMDKLRRQAEEIAQLKIPTAKTSAESPGVVAVPEQRPLTQAKQHPGQSIKNLIPSISKVERPPGEWAQAQRPGMVKPVVEGNRLQQAPLPPPPISNVDVQVEAGQAPQVNKTSPIPKPNPTNPGPCQIQQISKVLLTSSQETDYGDADLDGLGELGLGLTQFLGPDKDLSWLDEDDDDF